MKNWILKRFCVFSFLRESEQAHEHAGQGGRGRGERILSTLHTKLNAKPKTELDLITVGS